MSVLEQSYLTLGESAQRMGLRVADVMAMTERSELPFLRLSDEELLIPASAVDAQRLIFSSRALLVLRDDDGVPKPTRKTLAQRRRLFLARTGCAAEHYVRAFEDGDLDSLDENVASHVVEAEELLAAERRH